MIRDLGRGLLRSAVALAAVLAVSCQSAGDSPLSNSNDSSQARTTEGHGQGLSGANAPPVLLVGIDGFRYDYLDLFEPPSLLALARSGGFSERLVPSFPSKTFPNHYTLVTGLVPDHHGIVSNNILDPELGGFSLGNREAVSDGRWWQGEPVWVTAERRGIPAAALFWPGSEAEINGFRPTFWTPYDDDLPGETRVQQILDWLALPTGQRPGFATLYFSRVDSASHRHGPESREAREAVLQVDALIGSLRRRLEARGQAIHWILVSDHGMSETSAERVVLVDELINMDEVTTIDLSPVLAIFPSAEAASDPEWAQRQVAALDRDPHVDAYRKQDLPAHLHHGQHPRVAPVLGLIEEGWRFSTHAIEQRSPQTGPEGQHGYDPANLSMGGLLIVAGPRIVPGTQLGPVENVDVYSLICELMGIAPMPSDGSLDSLQPLLRTPQP